MRNLDVTLVLYGPPTRLANSHDLNLIVVPSRDKAVKRILEADGILIVTTSEASSLPPLAQPMILSSHHPFDSQVKAILRVQNVVALHNVGAYQTYSNSKKGLRTFWIPNFYQPISRKLEEPPAICHRTVVGHISSLHPSKGFHNVLAVWKRVHQRFPHAVLEVIGGSNLYGDVEHPDKEINASHQYAERLRRIAGASFDEMNISFLGILNSGEIARQLEQWNVAVLNPYGISEADPASVKDCLGNGVPVISSSDFGMWDLMHHLPELAVRSILDLECKLTQFLENGLEVETEKKIVKIREQLVERNLALQCEWELVLRTLGAKSFPVSNGLGLELPVLPAGKRLELFLRKIVYRFTILQYWEVYLLERASLLISGLRERLDRSKK